MKSFKSWWSSCKLESFTETSCLYVFRVSQLNFFKEASHIVIRFVFFKSMTVHIRDGAYRTHRGKLYYLYMQGGARGSRGFTRTPLVKDHTKYKVLFRIFTSIYWLEVDLVLKDWKLILSIVMIKIMFYVYALDVESSLISSCVYFFYILNLL